MHSSKSLIQDEIKDQESQENTNDWKTVKIGVSKKQRRSSTGTKSKYTSMNNKPNRTDSGAAAQDDERITVVVGDSIIKNVHEIKVAKAVGHRVVVKPFPGAYIRDMKSHIIPTIERSPDQICLHVGTIDLRSSPPNDVADAIVDLARAIEGAYEAEIIVSELTTRNDANGDAVKAVNRRLKQFCRQN